ncbi:MAG: DUF4302 domain-containing protein [Arcicella sp.]|nr:DUF4302 domain-containing protein [Arcicella sp.]
MKKIFIYILFFQLAFLSCKKSEIEPLFTESANLRAANQIATYKKQLSDAQYGWRGVYYPNGGQDGGYTFYLKFDDKGNVTMYSDLAGFTAEVSFVTTYQVKALQKPTLVFDSYSYLHELVNPDYNGGTGALADLELSYVSATDTKIVLKGILNNTQMELTKMTQVESDALTKGGFASTFKSTLNYINGGSFLSLVFPTGEKTDVFANLDTKIFSIFYVQNNQVRTISSAFSVTTTGIQLRESVTLFGVRFNELIWDDALKIYYINADGKRINFTKSNTPLVPFDLAIGNLFSFVDFDPTISGQNAAYKTVFSQLATNIPTLPFRLTLESIFFSFNTTTGQYDLFIIVVQNGVRFAAVINYRMNKTTAQNRTFTRTGINGNANLLLTSIKPLIDILEKDTFTFDYDPTDGRFALLKSLTTPTFAMKGRLE